MTQATLVVGGLFLLVYGPLALLAWRRPLLARFAWRESTRRRGQFALMVLGLMVASASITAAMVGADSGVQTLAPITDQRLGAVDLTVTDAHGDSFPLSVASDLASDPALTPYIDGVQAGVEQQASVADLDRRLGKPGVLMVGFDPQSQHRFGAYALVDGRRIYGAELGPGDVLLSQGLAAALDAKAGDRVRIATGVGSGATFDVYGITTPAGPGGYGSYLAAFMTLAASERITNDLGINVVRIAARGSSPTDPTAASRAAGPMRSAVSRIAAGSPLLVNEIRPDALKWLAGMTQAVFGEFLVFTSLTILAAIALIVNLVLALAEERRRRLAVLRALGLTRTGLVTLSVLEGALYSLAAATVGVAAGVPAGIYLANQLWNAATIDPADTMWLGYSLHVAVSPGALAVGFAAGALVTLGTVAAAAYRTNQIAIASAIRDLPDPASRARRRWPRIALLVAVAVLGFALLVPDDLRTRFVGGVALIAAFGALARGRLPDRLRATLTGLVLSAWAVIMTASAHTSNDWYQIAPVIVMSAAASVTGLAIAGAANLKVIDFLIGLTGRRAGLLQATLRPALAYMSRRPVRTGLVTTAFSLVLVLITVVAAAAGAPKPDYASHSAGFDVEVVTSSSEQVTLPPDLQTQVASSISMPMRAYEGPTGGLGSSTTVTLYVLPQDPASAAPVYLSSRDSRFASDAAVWEALRSDPHLAVEDFVGSGGVVTLQGVNGPVQLQVAGQAGPSVLQGIIVTAGVLAEIDTKPAGSTLLLKARPGSDPQTLARQIEARLFDQGVQAIAIRDILNQDYASGLDYATEYDVLLYMGLIVGVLALAMLSIRAAIERRRAIGILRALGYRPARLLAGIVAEALVITTIGVMTGVAAGLIDGYAFLGSFAPGQPIVMDFSRLLVALAIVYVSTLTVTVFFGSRAARMAPAEAIRITG